MNSKRARKNRAGEIRVWRVKKPACSSRVGRRAKQSAGAFASEMSVCLGVVRQHVLLRGVNKYA